MREDGMDINNMFQGMDCPAVDTNRAPAQDERVGIKWKHRFTKLKVLKK